jgi:hypothetical protein
MTSVPIATRGIRLSIHCLVLVFLISLSPVWAALNMVKIAQLPQQLGTNFPVGDANGNDRYEIWGNSGETLVAFEYQGNGQFSRINTGALVHEAWAFGDGDNDGLMEVVGDPSAGCAVIWESPAPDSFPSESVGEVHHYPAASYCLPKYADLDRDSRQELVISVFGIRVFENVGNNRYDSVAVLNDSNHVVNSDFAIGDFDGDSLTDIVAGINPLGYIVVFEATGQDNQYQIVARCSTDTYNNGDFASAHDIDGRPEFIVFGRGYDSLGDYGKVMVYEAVARAQYQHVWEQTRYDIGFFGPYPISVGSVDGQGVDEFAVNNGGGSIFLYKCDGPHSYSQVWRFDSAGWQERLFDINQDSRAEVIFDGPQGTEIWEDTEGLGVAEFSKVRKPHVVSVQPTITRLGAPVVFSGLPPGADIEVLSLAGRLISRASGVRQSTWTWNLRNQSGNLVPAGTYFAVIRSKEKATSLKLCVVK